MSSLREEHKERGVDARRRRAHDAYLLHHSLEVALSRDPQHVAFAHGDAVLTYAQLYARVAATAQCLVRMGISNGDRVGLFCSKGIDTTVALYATLVAGAAYVPLDPRMPSGRLRQIIDDCRIAAIFSDTARCATLYEALDGGVHMPKALLGDFDVPPGQRFSAHADWAAINSHTCATFPNVRILEQDLAYIMYTSGSTGQPKGLMHTHASGFAYARLAANLFQLTPVDRLANLSPLHFDMSTLDYLAGPFCGASTIIVSEEDVRFPATVTELLERERITCWYSVPYAMQQMLHYGVMSKRDLSSLRLMICAGDRLPADALRSMMERLPHTRFVNVYGPAEVNQCTHYEVPRPLPKSVADVPIGKPWGNTEVIIVDDNALPVTDGRAGELLVRSSTVMHGYWSRPELNERIFHSVTTDGGFVKRYLRTGDMVVRENDGELRFLGRKDRQIKLRGFRIELDEIEAALNGAENVEEAAAVVIDHPSNGRQIHACVTLIQDTTIAQRELQLMLRAKLPRYALPASIAVLPSFPRTSSRKIDRRSLVEQLTVALCTQDSADTKNE